ncbi:hypothetical protein L195_g061407, partial [Trifolium pratense]
MPMEQGPKHRCQQSKVSKVLQKGDIDIIFDLAGEDGGANQEQQ